MSVLVVYGSQTGTAEDSAEYVCRECLHRALESRACSMDSVSLDDILKEKCVIFVCSTTGAGEEPINMKQFWRSLLKRSLPGNMLQDVSYCVLGFGDSSYPKYNYVAKRLYRRLQGLGGKPLVELGLADDQHPDGADSIAFKWVENLWPNIEQLFDVKLERKVDSILPPRYKVEITSSGVENESTLQGDGSTNGNDSANGTTQQYNREYPYTSKLLSSSPLTSVEHFQDVRLLKFDCTGLEYRPGHVVWIYPRNIDSFVEEATAVLGLNLNDTVTVSPGSHTPPAHLPTTLTVRQLLTNHIDIRSQPKRYFFELLASFTKSEIEQEKFVEFTQAEGQDELFSYVCRPRRTILEVLQDFHSARENLNLAYLLDLVPLMKPRGFSIASAQCTGENVLETCMAVVKYRTNLKVERLGVCSTWLSTLPLHCAVDLWCEPGSLFFPRDTPLIMVGPGTGCAPFRSLIQERAGSQDLLLFYGCRNEEEDYFFREEWQGVERLRVVTAFSRDQEHKIYVQHRITEHSSLVWDLLQRGACIYIAGTSKQMPTQVRSAFTTVVSTQGGLTAEEAEGWVEGLVKCKRYQTETW